MKKERCLYIYLKKRTQLYVSLFFVYLQSNFFFGKRI